MTHAHRKTHEPRALDASANHGAAVSVVSGAWFAIRLREPEDGQDCEVKLRSGTRYHATWVSFGGVGGFMLDVTHRRIARENSSPITHWRPLANIKVSHDGR